MRIGTLGIIAALTLLGSVAFAQKVTFDFDPAADFSKFKTYAWVRGTNVDDELSHRHIVAAIDAQLTRKGLTKVETSGVSMNPDVLVAYHAAFERDRRIGGFSSRDGYRFGGHRSAAASDVIEAGTLAMDIVDARTRTIVWRGVAVKQVDLDSSGEQREREIDRAAEKLFRKYPPKK